MQYPSPLNHSTFNINSDNFQKYQTLATQNPDQFWLEMANRIDWHQSPTKSGNWQFDKPVSIKWFEDGFLNVSENCIDRHAAKTPEKTAIIWVDDEGKTTKHISYKELLKEVNAMANSLQQMGVKKADTVVIYMPMVPEIAYAMLACARIGAIHSVVFGGFSPESLAGRIQDCDAKIVITTDEGIRAGKTIPLKNNVDIALKNLSSVSKVLVTQRTKQTVNMLEGRDYFYDPDYSKVIKPESINAEDPLFILYTSGSTGKPKGVLHTSGGYLVYASLTHEWIFDIKPDDIYWCTADCGWITGHSYLLYGPLANGATTVMFEGVPNYPNPDRFWQIVDDLKVSVFYTAPTAIRSLMQAGDHWLDSSKRDSLRILGSVGEPINQEAWEWYYHKVGKEKCRIVDTWWQTETGGIMITPLPGIHNLKPGAATQPFFGINPVLLDDHGKQILENPAEGNLAIKASWPGQMRTIFNDHQRFENSYFTKFAGYYFSGDGAKRDADGDYWISGRVDDVLNVSGHRLSTAEIETAATLNHAIVETAVVGFPHPIKGEGIMIFAITSQDAKESEDEIKTIIKQSVRTQIGAIASPDVIHIVKGLPKTRSGKIMRRILRALASGDASKIGDTSTLADASIVEHLQEIINATKR
jgi:acetyl-CoA synthetase